MSNLRTAAQIRPGTTFWEPGETCYGREPRPVTLPRFAEAHAADRLPAVVPVHYNGGMADVVVLDGHGPDGKRIVVAYVPSQRLETTI